MMRIIRLRYLRVIVRPGPGVEIEFTDFASLPRKKVVRPQFIGELIVDDLISLGGVGQSDRIMQGVDDAGLYGHNINSLFIDKKYPSVLIIMSYSPNTVEGEISQLVPFQMFIDAPVGVVNLSPGMFNFIINN